MLSLRWFHNGAMAFQITSLTIVYLAVYSDTDQRKHQSSTSLSFVRGIRRGPVNSPHKWLVTRKMFPFHDVIMWMNALSFWVCVCQQDVSKLETSNYIPQYLWDVITCPCPWYLLLAHKSLFVVNSKWCKWLLDLTLSVMLNQVNLFLSMVIITCMNRFTSDA